MNSLTAASKSAIGIASALAAVCILAGALGILIAVDENGEGAAPQHPEAIFDTPMSASDIPIYCPVIAENDTVAFADSIDTDRIAAVCIYNYPSLGPNGNRYATNEETIEQAAHVLEHAHFMLWDGYRSYEERRRTLAGGYYSSLALLDEAGRTVVQVGFDPGMPSDANATGETGIYVIRDDACYRMEADQSAVIETIGAFVLQAKAETGIGCGEMRLAPAEERTWLLEDEFAASLDYSAEASQAASAAR